MPFIDEDRFYENIEEKYKFAQGEARKAYSDVLDTICEMPRADAQEVRHGRWINESRQMYGPISAQCSVCELFSGTWLRNAPYKYCPHCGAKMDGKE